MRPTTRSAFLRATAGALAGLTSLPALARAATRSPSLARIAVRNPGRRYAGDRELLATVAPGIPGRDTAVVSFHLPQEAVVRLDALRTGVRRPNVVWTVEEELPAGAAELAWTPRQTVGSYAMRLTVERDGKSKVYGGVRPLNPLRSRAPVVRVVGVQAAFERRSYDAGEPMGLTIFCDTPSLTLTFLRCGPESVSSGRADEMSGVPMAEPVPIDWTGKQSAPVTIRVQTGDWPTGLYTARLQTGDGRVGFAPFILRPKAPGTTRTAIVLPTYTWQAYNFHDADGDGWGDTWYAGGNPAVLLDRPYRDRGVPPRYRRYDLPFLKWLHTTGKAPEFLAEDDLEEIPSGDVLRQRYDLVVFPGHTEYVTAHEYDVVERFRDLGGRLVFLSANNFFWRVDRSGQALRRVELWRKLGRPESRLLGVQYKANDDGAKQRPYYVVDPGGAPWLFEGTGLRYGSTIGESVGGYGIEVDGTTADSPPGTKVLALVPSLFGAGLHGEMAYYETAAGARVFSAGTLDFGGSVLAWPQRRLLDNLWRYMLQDVPPPPA